MKTDRKRFRVKLSCYRNDVTPCPLPVSQPGATILYPDGTPTNTEARPHARPVHLDSCARVESVGLTAGGPSDHAARDLGEATRVLRAVAGADYGCLRGFGTRASSATRSTTRRQTTVNLGPRLVFCHRWVTRRGWRRLVPEREPTRRHAEFRGDRWDPIESRHLLAGLPVADGRAGHPERAGEIGRLVVTPLREREPPPRLGDPTADAVTSTPPRVVHRP